MTTTSTAVLMGDLNATSATSDPLETASISRRLSTTDANDVAEEDAILDLVRRNETLFQATELLFELHRHQLEWIEMINCIYCSLCKFCIQRDVRNVDGDDGDVGDENLVRNRNINATLRHLRDKHKKGPKSFKTLTTLLEQSEHPLVSKPGTQLATTLLDKESWLARVSCPEEELPQPIAYLQITEGIMCTVCGYCTVQHSTMKTHHAKYHKEHWNSIAVSSSDGITDQQKYVPRLMQHIFAATKKGFFAVRRYQREQVQFGLYIYYVHH